MPVPESASRGSDGSFINIWDSEYCPPSEAFSFFREVICSIFMPWSPEFKSEDAFEGRVKGSVFGDKSIARINISPLVAVRNVTSVANSTVDGFYANFVLSGEAHVEQAGHSSIARQGDLVVYDTARPVVMSSRSDLRYEDIAFLIPKRCFSHIPDAEDHFGNIVVERRRLISPLYSNLMFLAQNMQSMSKDELISLYDSFVSLLPLAVSCNGKLRDDGMDAAQGNCLWQEIKDFLDRNLAEPELSPATAAQHFEISVRYVHKLFARNGTTFGAYIAAKRLDNIRDDLISPTCRNLPISSLAFRWGFRDLSSFNRAFKRHFDCNPRHYRERHCHISSTGRRFRHTLN